MPRLSKQTIAKMRAVIQAVLAEPEYYDQSIFPLTKDCGEVCCAAGWAVWLDDPVKYPEIVKSSPSWPTLARKTLGIPNATASLFEMASSWPKPFWTAYYATENSKGRAKAMADRWEHFIATGGRE